MDGPPAMSLGWSQRAPASCAMRRAAPDARILTGPRFARLFVYGLTMAVGTLGCFIMPSRGARPMP